MGEEESYVSVGNVLNVIHISYRTEKRDETKRYEVQQVLRTPWDHEHAPSRYDKTRTMDLEAHTPFSDIEHLHGAPERQSYVYRVLD